MAPKKAAAPKKGKAPMQAGKSAAAPRSAEPQGVLPRSRINSAGVDKVRYLASAETNEHGATRMEPAGSLIRAFYIIIFIPYIIILECYLHCYIVVFACFR